MLRIIVAIVILVAGGLLWFVYWGHTGLFAEVHEGQLYRSGEMPAERLIEHCEEHGIKTVVDFRHKMEGPRAEAKALAAVGVRHVHVPSTQVPPIEVVEKFLEVMDDPANRPVLIHCEHGVGRTGVMAAIYRMEFQGWNAEDARREAQLFAGFDSFEEGCEKRKMVESYVPRSKREQK